MKQYIGKIRFITFISLLALAVLMSGCSTQVKRKDGPPKFAVDETRVPDATPKPEKLAKYGNMRSYVVFGKRYYTMKSAKNYEAVGTASWYGTQFHAHRTSSGEPYNMLGMTAAHKTLPLPTYVEVTNLKNNRKIIVKVNDRGPFESNRLIDLSYVAAKKLGMLGHGTAQVRIKAIDPYSFNQQLWLAKNTPSPVSKLSHIGLASNSPSQTFKPLHNFAAEKPRPLFNPIRITTNSRSSFKPSLRHTPSSYKPEAIKQYVYLQIGAFRNRVYAEQLQARMMALLSHPVSISRPNGSSNLYRVKIGPLHDVAVITQITNRLKSLGIKSNKLYG